MNGDVGTGMVWQDLRMDDRVRVCWWMRDQMGAEIFRKDSFSRKIISIKFAGSLFIRT
jgi:hypothetical protein